MQRLETTIAFFSEHPRVALALAGFFTLGGIASVLGFLRAQTPFFQWALAAFLWAIAVFATVTAIRALRR
jgi:hypothetical protein